MGLKDCLVSAEKQKAITREERLFLQQAFDARFSARRGGMSDDAAKAEARRDLEADLRAEAAEKRRRADLTEARRIAVKKQLQGFRDKDGKADPFTAALGLLSHYGFRGASSVRGRAEAITATAHARIADVMFSFERRGVLGRRANKALLSDVLKELHGEAAGDATAKALAKSIADTFEDLRQRFNAAGGAIGSREDFGLPHSHDRKKIMALGRTPEERRTRWKAQIAPLLDASKMANPLTGRTLDAASLDAALDHVFASIVSEGRAHLTPQAAPTGKGALASQRQEERFLAFRDAASWEAYHRRFGQGDPVQSIFHHVNSMARDIAAMEVLGPNPGAMVEYMKQAVAHEIGKAEAGLPSLAKEPALLKMSAAAYAQWRLDSLWQSLRGQPTVISGFAGAGASIKNLLTSAQLGATALLAAATDPFVAAAARRLAGLPQTAAVADMAKMLKTANRREIIRAGVVWDEYLHVMQDELRFAGPAIGADWSRWLADRTVVWSGLKPLTTGRKLVEARAWQGHIADLKDMKFSALDARFRRALEGFGVTEDDWDIWRHSIDAAGFVTPAEIERRGGPVRYIDRKTAPIREAGQEWKALRHRAAAEKLAELTSSWSERSVPSGTPNARSFVTGMAARGTVGGEIVDYMLQYKSFGLSFTALQLEALGEMAAAKGGGRGTQSGLAYGAALVVPLTLGAAAYLQIKALFDGREPESMHLVDNPGFWVKALFQGGGFGLVGDFVKASENRFGQSFGEAMLGPVPAFVGNLSGLTAYNAIEAAQGEPTRAGREAVEVLRRYTPVLSSHWATRGAYNRLVLDNLQWLADPDADASFKAMARSAKKSGTPFRPGFEPGALAPR